MAKKKNEGSTFEIIVVLAIVLIVAVTGQVLVTYDQKGLSAASRTTSSATSDNSPTGFVTAGDGEDVTVVDNPFIDISVKNIDVNPPSPLLGQPFEVKVTLANEGKSAISTPFYVQLELTPNGGKPVVFNSVVGQVLDVGEENTAVFNIAMVSQEGPVKIVATADSTAKLDDINPSNDQRSKTIIITSQ